MSLLLWTALLPMAVRAAPSPGPALSAATAGRMAALESKLFSTETGRRMLAEASAVPREESDSAGAAIRTLRDPAAVAVDSKRLARLSDWEAELALARELALAGLDVPFEMPEAAMSATLAQLRHCLERAAQDPEFDAWLRKSHQLMARRHVARQVVDLKRPARTGALREPPLPYPRGELDRAGYYLYLFAKDPEEFYWAVEWGQPFGPGSVKWTDLQDFLDRRQGEVLALTVPPGALYVRVDGRRYPAALVAAAKKLAQSGDRERLAALFSFLDDDSAAQRLRARIREWTRTKDD